MTCPDRSSRLSFRRSRPFTSPVPAGEVNGGGASLKMRALCAGVALAALTLAAPARARVGVVFGFAPPIWVPPPAYYYPPPVYYPPPPVYYTPPRLPPWYVPTPPVTHAPPAYQGGSYAATTCYAPAYVCPMETRVSIGTVCWCADNAGGRAYGRAG